MSRNKDRILKALKEKGYTIEWLKWSPIRRGMEMCGPEGGWDIFTEQGEHILDYNIKGVMKQIERLPKVVVSE